MLLPDGNGPFYDTSQYASKRFGVITPGLSMHATLQFVGRDLTSKQVREVIYATFCWAQGPLRLRFTGQCEWFLTGKGRYLVAKIEPTPELMAHRDRLRSFIETSTEAAGVEFWIKDDFQFNPHVALLEMPPGPRPDWTPDAVSSFEVTASVAEVKYGTRRMLVNL